MPLYEGALPLTADATTPAATSATPAAPSPAAHQPFAPYGTPDAPRVAVVGEARIDVDPEIARIGVTVTVRGTDRRAALDDLARRNTAVLEVIRSYGEAVERVETGAFSVSPELTRSGRGERVRAYHGAVYISAEVGDFTVAGELMTRIADLELTQVEGPQWRLRPSSPAYAEARRTAVREAVRRAREYAEALGARLTALLELSDQGAEQATPYGGADSVVRVAPYAALAGAESAPDVELEPRRLTVEAQVTARFLMTPPRL